MRQSVTIELAVNPVHETGMASTPTTGERSQWTVGWVVSLLHS